MRPCLFHASTVLPLLWPTLVQASKATAFVAGKASIVSSSVAPSAAHPDALLKTTTGKHRVHAFVPPLVGFRFFTSRSIRRCCVSSGRRTKSSTRFQSLNSRLTPLSFGTTNYYIHSQSRSSKMQHHGTDDHEPDFPLTKDCSFMFDGRIVARNLPR